MGIKARPRLCVSERVGNIIKVSDGVRRGYQPGTFLDRSPKGASRASRRLRSSRFGFASRRDDLEAGFPVPHSKNI